MNRNGNWIKCNNNDLKQEKNKSTYNNTVIPRWDFHRQFFSILRCSHCLKLKNAYYSRSNHFMTFSGMYDQCRNAEKILILIVQIGIPSSRSSRFSLIISLSRDVTWYDVQPLIGFAAIILRFRLTTVVSVWQLFFFKKPSRKFDDRSKITINNQWSLIVVLAAKIVELKQNVFG